MAQPKYEIMERIGAGGMAEVFKASSTSLKGFQKLVAIKRVLPNLTQNDRFVRMFLDEAKIALPLNHTNIVQTFDLGIADETYFIVMEYVEGTDLKEIIQELNDRRAQMSIAEVAFVGIEICEGLAHAHGKTDPSGEELDIVHRDISPPNILLSRDGEVKITDFGLAKAKSQAELTDPGVVKGKFGYLSPEAAHGEDIDERTDIFAVGILLWELLTGRRLFLGESDYETLKKVRKAEVPPLEQAGRSAPEPFERIIRKALAKEVDARFQTARQLGTVLAEFVYARGEPVTGFDLATYVDQVLGERVPAAEPDLAPADRAVQQEINEFVSVEDLEDLDKRLANQEDIGEEVDVEPREDGNFEDPRAWDDVGVTAEEMDVDETSDAVPSDDVSSSDEWREQELSDVAKATQSFEAIGGPAEEEASGGREREGQRQRRSEAAGRARPAEASAAPTEGRPPEAEEQGGGQQPAAAPNRSPEKTSEGGSTLPVLALILAVLAVIAAGAYYYLEVV